MTLVEYIDIDHRCFLYVSYEYPERGPPHLRTCENKT